MVTANYVVQKALCVASQSQFQQLSTIIKPHLLTLRNTNFGKRIQSKISKRFPDFQQSLINSDHNVNHSNYHSRQQHFNQNKNTIIKTHKTILPTVFTFRTPNIITSDQYNNNNSEGQQNQLNNSVGNHFANKNHHRTRNRTNKSSNEQNQQILTLENYHK